MNRLVLLLRGINVGKAKQVGMADLQELLTDAGYADVRTHLRSGNVVVGTSLSPAAAAADASSRIQAHFGFPVGVVVRTADELQATVDADPLGEAAGNPSRHMVAFLDVEPAATVVHALEAAAVEPERFAVVGRDVHLWLPTGVTGSPLNKALTPA
ncbi:MAG: hypothetical protein JWP18_1406, partial [Solirubrobacterales bacterium]|nr:hypothetical protein [Solirubrobacterales bacterium]